MESKKKLIVDVDTGVDDAQAIMMALADDTAEVLAITCVSGNADVHQACINTLRVLRVCDRLDIPVYKGSDKSLLGSICDRGKHHGEDGLGDCPDPQGPPDPELIQEEHAVNALIRIVNQNQGEISLVAVGPLTNIALALRLDPHWGTKLKEAVIMGGNTRGIGNIKLCGEFNFYTDPEAAFVVLDQLRCTSLTLLPWESCLDNSVDWEWSNKTLDMGTNKARFARAITTYSDQFKQKVLKLKANYLCDPCAMAVALHPEIVLTSVKHHCTVELQGQFTRGMMVVDWNDHLQKERTVHIIKDIDVDSFKALYKKMLQ